MLIRCDQTGIVFPTQKAAASAMGLALTCVSRNVNGTKPHVKGWTFTRIASADEPFTPVDRFPPAMILPPVRLRCNQTGVIFPSLRDTAKQMKLQRRNLRNHIRDRIKHPFVKGYSFTRM